MILEKIIMCRKSHCRNVLIYMSIHARSGQTDTGAMVRPLPTALLAKRAWGSTLSQQAIGLGVVPGVIWLILGGKLRDRRGWDPAFDLRL